MNSNPIPFLIQGLNVILVIDGKSHTVSRDTHMNYNKIVESLKAKDWDSLRELVEPKKAIINFGKGNVTINGNDVLWKGQPFHNALSTRMISMYQEGFPIEPMVHFMENLMQNPSKRSVDQVYGFLEKNSLPITEDGYFLAYKRVREDYLDIHSGTIDNSIGEIVEMDRNAVDDNPDSHCSTGLHFCSESYLGSFGSSEQPVMILKINPADVVSIPTDYNGAKGRCMRYEVVGEIDGDPKSAFSSVVNREYSSSPKSSWPFATPDECGDCEDCDDLCDDCNTHSSCDDDVYYDVQRRSNGEIVETDIGLDEARAMVAKNVRQKKAQLIIVESGTDIEVQ